MRLLRRLVALGFGPGDFVQETRSVYVAFLDLVDNGLGDFEGVHSDHLIEGADKLATAFTWLELGYVCRELAVADCCRSAYDRFASLSPEALCACRYSSFWLLLLWFSYSLCCCLIAAVLRPSFRHFRPPFRELSRSRRGDSGDSYEIARPKTPWLLLRYEFGT